MSARPVTTATSGGPITDDAVRATARALARDALASEDPLSWFETLYAAAAEGEAVVPWADLTVNPHLASWSGLADLTPGRALVVGCGYGDDAAWLAERGWQVTAFDLSATAVLRARERFGDDVRWLAADLLDLPGWEPFDLVVEIYTIQVLPPGSIERGAGIAALRWLTGRDLLVVARGREESDPPGSMPWPLTRAEVESIADDELRVQTLEELLDDEEPPVRRLRAHLRRVSPA